MKARALFIAAVALASASPARAQEVQITGPLYDSEVATRRAPADARDYGVGEAELVAGFERAVAPHPGPVAGLGEVGLSARFLYGDRVGYAGGATLAAGASDRGFAGEALLYPLGFGAAIGATGFAALYGGAGAGGWGYAPAGLELPVDARVAFDIATHVRLTLDACVAWVPAVTARQGGAPHLPLGDEARFGVTTRIGRLWSHGRMHDAGGYFFRLEHAEMLGTSFLGLAIGYQMAGSG